MAKTPEHLIGAMIRIEYDNIGKRTKQLKIIQEANLQSANSSKHLFFCFRQSNSRIYFLVYMRTSYLLSFNLKLQGFEGVTEGSCYCCTSFLTLQI